MRSEEPRAIYLKDYRPPAFFIDDVFLEVELHPTATTVRSRLSLRRNPEHGDAAAPLVLDGEKLTLKGLRLDGEALGANRFRVNDASLMISDLPQACTLEVETTCDPQANSELEGLYLSSGIFCTQCEAEGFRRITYFLDRPDVMATYRTRIIGDPEAQPVLLSNGNLVEEGQLPGGRHYAEWHDPFPKPSYLFALVAGDLACIEDSFTTASGREVRLKIFVEPGKEERCDYAMGALKRAMRWDEERFGREYDLDIFMIVAVSSFNMGAMENKGLNVFNDRYILASPETATDVDFARVEAIIAHEYFHNWTGNRITCRDWFQLCLKEGLTVYRDQEFTSDLRSRSVKRIEDVRNLRARQFPEDQGPLSHPVRPNNYIEINNFYTATVYEKGAELVRMIATLAGPQGFRRGMDLYFERHDGEAATVEDFLTALADGAKLNLGQFKRWYDQAGTPEVRAEGRYDAEARTYTLTLAQHCTPTPGQPEKEPLHIPVAMGLLGPDGEDLPLRLKGESRAHDKIETTRVLSLTEAEQAFVFVDLPKPPVASLLRGFSAPVVLRQALSNEERIHLMTHDTADDFNRWEAIQTYASGHLLNGVEAIKAGRESRGDEALVSAFANLLSDETADPAFTALALLLPSEQTLAQTIAREVDPDAVHQAREALRREVGAALAHQFEARYREAKSEGPYSPDAKSAGLRSLRNACLGYLTATPGNLDLAFQQFEDADNMTESIAALSLIAESDHPRREDALDAFYRRWKDDPLVLDKWFEIQATSKRADTLERVVTLTQHPAFTLKNPNRVRALVASFAAGNQVRFHAAEGGGYRFLAEIVLDLDRLNPQVAARLLSAFKAWRQFDARRREAAAAELERIARVPSLSRNSYEIATKTLA